MIGKTADALPIGNPSYPPAGEHPTFVLPTAALRPFLRERRATRRAERPAMKSRSTGGCRAAGSTAVGPSKARIDPRPDTAEDPRRTFAYRGVIEASLDPLVTIGPDGRITDVNHATETATGAGREEIIGTDFADYFTDPERARASYVMAFREGSVRDYSLELRHRDGQLSDVLYNVAVYRDEFGEVVGVFAAARDVTVLKRADREIRTLNADLERRVQERTASLEAANHELEAFSYSVSHDLRAPLRAIDGFSRILLTDHASQLDEEACRVLNVIVRNARQMGVLIDDLLAFSRVVRREPERRQVDMERLVASVVADLALAEPERRIAFDVGPLCPAWGDLELLRHVWTNLLGNAAKFTGPIDKPAVEVRCVDGSGECRYTVHDNGVGFDQAYAGQLFEPFQRLHAASEFEGTGIGLAIVSRIVRRHGGSVWAEGIPNVGATFGFALPGRGDAP